MSKELWLRFIDDRLERLKLEYALEHDSIRLAAMNQTINEYVALREFINAN
jgi:hypothetical protein